MGAGIRATPTAFVRRRTWVVRRLRGGSPVLDRRSFSGGGKSGHDECVSRVGSASHTPTSISNGHIVCRHNFAISRRDAPELCMKVSPRIYEGVGTARRTAPPQPRVQG